MQAQTQLTEAGRMDDPHQLQRLRRTDRPRNEPLVDMRSGLRHGGPHTDPAHAIAYTGLARIAVETACMEAMTLVQRSLGVAAFFRRGSPVELFCRDLATYPRQPAPDAVLTEAAAHFAARHAMMQDATSLMGTVHDRWRALPVATTASVWRCAAASLPTRTGTAPSWPASQGSSCS
jgi:hypothetical protein